jgi:hypothetical protein
MNLLPLFLSVATIFVLVKTFLNLTRFVKNIIIFVSLNKFIIKIDLTIYLIILIYTTNIYIFYIFGQSSHEVRTTVKRRRREYQKA